MLYLSVKHPELTPPTPPSLQAIFDQGHDVGREAQKRFPNGVLIEAEAYDAQKGFEATIKAIKEGANTIYEATFIHENVQARLDILHRKNSKSAWELIEVKSGTSVEEVHLKDIAIQLWVATGAGIQIKTASLMHINNKCTFPNLKDLFLIQDVTKELKPHLEDVPNKIREVRKMLQKDKAPKIDIGPHCSDPYGCPYINHCWSHIPEFSVFDLPRIGKKAWELYNNGITELNDEKLLKPNWKINDSHKRIIEIQKSKKRWIDKIEIKKELREWIEPLSYLDFETVGFAIPRYKGTRPYQQIPFQFSVQIPTRGELKNIDYLHTDSTDPRPPLIEALIAAIPKKGSVVSYNKGFEAARINEMADAFPKYKKQLIEIIERLVDPLPIFRSAVYDDAFQGSFSIKAVAPAILGKKYSYENLEVGDGQAASQGFMDLVSGKLFESESKELISKMLIYCQQDTEAMARLVEWLKSI